MGHMLHVLNMHTFVTDSLFPKEKCLIMCATGQSYYHQWFTDIVYIALYVYMGSS